MASTCANPNEIVHQKSSVRFSFRKIAVQKNGFMKWSVTVSVENVLKILVGAVIRGLTVRGLFGIITSAEM